MYDNISLICPLCSEKLRRKDKSYVCENRHSFDIAKQGYVNLLPVQSKHSLTPGDTKSMLSARRNFLDKGMYEPVCRSVCERLKKYVSTQAPVVIDAGCGEGYYTCAVMNEGFSCIGVDIAKEAARMACSRSKDVLWTVATVSHLPVASESADAVTAIFSLFMNDEYARVLKSGGIVVEITAGSKHLTELKQLIYSEVYEQHKKPSPFKEQFEQLECVNESFVFEVNHQELVDLLMMTPHIHRIKKEKENTLDNIEKLSITADYIIRVLRKRQG